MDNCFVKRFDLFKEAFMDHSPLPDGGYSGWLRRMRTDIYSECGYSNDCCKFCEDQRIIDLFYVRFYNKGFRQLEDFLQRSERMTDIYDLASFCKNLDESSSQRRNWNDDHGETIRKKKFETELVEVNNKVVRREGKLPGGQRKFQAEQVKVKEEQPEDPLNNNNNFVKEEHEENQQMPSLKPKESVIRTPTGKLNKVHELNVELEQLVNEMNNRRRPFGKDVMMQNQKPNEDKPFGKNTDELQLLKELLLDYGPHMKWNKRVARIAEHFQGTYSFDQVEHKLRLMRHGNPGKTLLFEKSLPPYKIWGPEEYYKLTSVTKFSERFELFDGQFSQEFVRSKLEEAKKYNGNSSKFSSKAEKKEHLNEELSAMVDDMNNKSRQFGKDIMLQDQEPRTCDPKTKKNLFEKEDMKLLKELLLSYGPHLNIGKRVARIMPHFGGRYTGPQIYDKIHKMKMGQIYGGSVLFNKELPPYKTWTMEDHKKLKEVKPTDTNLREVFDGQYSKVFILSKLKKYKLSKKIREMNGKKAPNNVPKEVATIKPEYHEENEIKMEDFTLEF